ncbi:MAG: Calx-beta domain-containing protein, partial [Verrucomicrobiota bacterium]
MKKNLILMKTARLIFFALAALALTSSANALVFYGSTAAGGPGELYILDPATGAVVQDIGPLNDSVSTNYGITGLAFHPFTGVLYGSTAGNDTNTYRKLVTINTNTALITVIGSYNAGNSTMGDIAFDSSGNLYGVSTSGGARLHSINIGTGQATLIGSSGVTFTEGGGLAISSTGVFFSTPTSGRFGTYNPVSGAYTQIVAPTRPVGGAYAALAFDGATLYGLNLGPSTSGYLTHIVTFDTSTGAVTDLASSVVKLDAIAFQPVIQPTVVSVSASIATANEQGPANGQFTLTRSGDVSGSLNVPYTISGTATPGTDYTSLSGSVTFLPGATSTNIAVSVIDESVQAESTETVILTINVGPGYSVGTPSATVSVLDNESPEISFNPVPPKKLLEGYATSKVVYQLVRRGLLTSALPVNLSYSGTATNGINFGAPSTVLVTAGAANANVTLTSINNQNYEGDKTATITIASGGYAVGTTNS